MPYCARCGKELAEDAKFCPNCGTPTPLVPLEELRRREREIRKKEECFGW